MKNSTNTATNTETTATKNLNLAKGLIKPTQKISSLVEFFSNGKDFSYNKGKSWNEKTLLGFSTPFSHEIKKGDKVSENRQSLHAGFLGMILAENKLVLKNSSGEVVDLKKAISHAKKVMTAEENRKSYLSAPNWYEAERKCFLSFGVGNKEHSSHCKGIARLLIDNGFTIVAQ